MMLKLSLQGVVLSFLVALLGMSLSACRIEHRAYEACIATCDKVTRCDDESYWTSCIQECSVEDWDTVTEACADLLEELHYCVGPVECNEIQFCGDAYRAVRDECNVPLAQISHAINSWKPKDPDQEESEDDEDDDLEL